MNPGSELTTRHLLSASLSVAVPLWQDRLRYIPWPRLHTRVTACQLVILEHGDQILYRSRKIGDSARAFNVLAEALAILSFLPGGVRFLDLHFETKHEDTGTDAS